MTGIYFGFARIHPLPSTSTESNPAEPSKTALSAAEIQSLPGRTVAYPPGELEQDQTAPAGKEQPLSQDDYKVWPMVMSAGYNPYYGNKEITAVSMSRQRYAQTDD